MVPKPSYIKTFDIKAVLWNMMLDGTYKPEFMKLSTLLNISINYISDQSLKSRLFGDNYLDIQNHEHKKKIKEFIDNHMDTKIKFDAFVLMIHNYMTATNSASET